MIIDYLKSTISELRNDFKDADTTGRLVILTVFAVAAILSFAIITVVIAFAVKGFLYLLPVLAAAGAVAWYMTRKK